MRSIASTVISLATLTLGATRGEAQGLPLDSLLAAHAHPVRMHSGTLSGEGLELLSCTVRDSAHPLWFQLRSPRAGGCHHALAQSCGQIGRVRLDQRSGQAVASRTHVCHRRGTRHDRADR
jgi:hypothetical protein